MSAAERLDEYLGALRTRLARQQGLRGLALGAVLALVLSVAAVALAIRQGFDHNLVAAARVLLLAVLAAVAVLVLRRVRALRRRVAREAEARAPSFDGRLTTFAGLEPTHPFKELLAEDALRISQRHPPEAQVPRAALLLPAVLGAAAVAVLVWLAAAGPGLYRYGVRDLWAGWMLSGLRPPLSISVTPGNQAVRRGGKLPVLAQMQGFDPAGAQVHARAGNGAWQDVDMTRSSRGFEFTFFSLREPLSYYVSAAGVRSAVYRINVVDVPNVDHLKLVYQYPDWTHLPPKTEEPGSDISAVAGTRVALEVRADAPLSQAELVLNGKGTDLGGEGGAHADIDVAADGRYYIAARIGGEQVRLTDDYLIKVLPDNKPEVQILRPGRDWSASRIEEVSTEVKASDDFALESLELRYAINGGAWQSVRLPVNGREGEAQHVFALEALRASGRELEPGDLISYYAVARDRSQSAQTDMYFVDVRPFDRRYTQEQAGGGGGGGGDEQSEISQRQREILVSTWNLVRRQNGTDADRGLIRDNSELLSSLQNKLAEQAQSLAQRSQARALDSSDTQIANFVQNLRQAAEAMGPAAKRLGALQLQAAIQPEQQALQYLLRAESQFTDMRVAMQRGGGGGGSQSASDLEDLYQLEMDLQKNQYENGSSASPQSGEHAADELARRLQELARREQQLADSARQQPELTEQQRWQQQALKREAEDLRRQLEQLAQNPGAQSQGAQSQGARSQGTPAQGGSGAAGAGGAVASRLDEAIRAMEQAGARADDAGASARARQAAAEAQRALSGANSELARARAEGLQRTIGDMANRAGRLYEQQASADQQLQSALRADAARRGAAAGLTPSEQTRLAGDKRELASQLQQLDQQLGDAARQYRADAPQAAQALTQAGHDLHEADLPNQLERAAQYIENGRAAYIAAAESGVTDGLRGLRDQLRQAAALAGARSAPERDAVGDELARVQALREQLQRLNAQAQAGQREPPQQAQRSAQGQGQSGAQSTGAAAPGSDSSGYAAAGGGPRGGLGGGELNDVVRGLHDINGTLRNRGVSAKDISAMNELARELAAAGITPRGDVIGRNLSDQVSLLEQLEAQLAASARPGGGGTIRAAVAEPVSDAYKEAVAEYYRQLSRE